MATSPAPGIRREAPDQRVILIGNAASLAGAIVFVVSATSMVALWIRLLFLSMNWLGFALGLLTAPVAAVYPFIHWFAHDFSAPIFLVWFIGVIGMATTLVWAAWGRHRALAPEDQQFGRGMLRLVATDEAE